MLRFSQGQPNSHHTLEFLKYLLTVAEEQGKRALLGTTRAGTKANRAWVKEHNRRAKRESGVRLLTYLLPTKSPWLNRQEAHWVHGKW